MHESELGLRGAVEPAAASRRRLGRKRFPAAWLAAMGLALLGLLTVLAAPSSSHLIVISIDGMVPQYYVRPDRFGLSIPHLRRLCRDGAFAEGVIGVYPSVTYPSHTTLISGARPSDHGIVANTLFDDPLKPPTKRWYWESSRIKSDTLWAAAARSGLTVASLFWPVTVGADAIDWNVPEIWDPFADSTWSAEILMKYASPSLVRELLDHQKQTASEYRHSDSAAVEAATYILERYKPNLLLLHLIDLDHEQHVYGPFSQQAFEKLENEDAGIGRVLEAITRAGIEDTTTVAVVSDHGFMRVDMEFNVMVPLVQDGLVRLDEGGRVVSWDAMVHSNTGSAGVYVRDSANGQVVARVRALFDAYTKGPDAPLARVIEREELDLLGANPRADLYLEPSAHFAIKTRLTGPVVQSAGEQSRGAHGYLAERPEMYSSFVIWGRHVRPRARLDLARMTDIAPTLAKVLGVQLRTPPYSHPLDDLLTRPPAKQ